MADDKSGDDAKRPDSLKRASGTQFRATEPLPPPSFEVEDPSELGKARRGAEAKEPAPGWSWRGILGTGAMGAAAFAGGFAAGGAPSMAHVQIMPTAAESVVNAIANGLASTSHLAPPEMKAEAESLFRQALSATWNECESLVKDISQDEIKELVKMGVGSFVLQHVARPLLRRLRAAPFNAIVFNVTEILQKLTDKLGGEPEAKLDEGAVVNCTEVTPEQAQLVLRALKLHQVDGRWLLETNHPALNVALSVERHG
jgi:hypothetical protein